MNEPGTGFGANRKRTLQHRRRPDEHQGPPGTHVLASHLKRGVRPGHDLVLSEFDHHSAALCSQPNETLHFEEDID